MRKAVSATTEQHGLQDTVMWHSNEPEQQPEHSLSLSPVQKKTQSTIRGAADKFPTVSR